jgi:hypothetical protein
MTRRGKLLFLAQHKDLILMCKREEEKAYQHQMTG